MSRYALLIGTQHYDSDKTLEELPAVQHDLQQMEQALSDRGQFTSIISRLDLTRQQMIKEVESFFGVARNGDMVLFYFSGHGLTSVDDKTLYLAGTDAEQAHVSAGGLNTSELWLALNQSSASQRLVLLDCCFSGTFGDTYRTRGRTRASFEGAKRARGTFIITSSGRLETSRERRHAPGQPSVFTGALLEALRDGGAEHDENGWLTARDLSTYVQQRVPREVPGQTPNEYSEGVTGPIPVALIGRSSAPSGQPTEGSAPESNTTGLHDGVDAPLDADRWRRLLGYYRDCIRNEARIGAYIPQAATDGYRILPSGPEQVLAGAHGRLPLPPALASFAQNAGQDLSYGYPLIVEQRRSGRGRRPYLTPLLLLDVDLDAQGRLHATWPPQVNTALMEDRGLDAVERDQLCQLIEERLVRGDPQSLQRTVTDVLRVLDLDASEVAPSQLDGVVRPGPSAAHIRNAAMLFRQDVATKTVGGLLRDLNEHLIPNVAKIPSTALGALADPETRQLAAPNSFTLVAPRSLNEAQEAVVVSAMTQRMTVAQGPPGTGKSQLVGAVIATATAAGQSVLLASTNNRPVDDVTGIANTLAPGLVMRTGNKQYRAEEPEVLTDLLDRYSAATESVVQTESRARGQLRAVAVEVERIRDELACRHRVEADLADLAAERAADASGSLVVELPDDDTALDRLMRRATRAARRGLVAWWYRHRFRRNGVSSVDDLLNVAQRAARELHWRERRACEADLPDVEPLWGKLNELTEKVRVAASQDLVRSQVHQRVAAGRRQLEQRRTAVRDNNTWRGFAKLLPALPAWATSALSSSTFVPNAGLFDLLIIDEAAQCGIAPILPLLYRAKRVLLIGDPQQIKPVVQLRPEDEKTHRARARLGDAWMEQRHLSFIADSAYSAAAAAVGDAPLLLDEHYRCHPDIVALPNRRLYDGKLTVLTDINRLAVTDHPAVVWSDCPGRVHRPASGSAINRAEADAVVDHVAELLAGHPGVNVGIVSPFQAQARLINRLLVQRGLPAEAGTVHRFQGSERDIMIISPVGAADIATWTRNWLLSEINLWNVAITRARSRMIVVGDRRWWAAQSGMLAELASAPAGLLARNRPDSPTTDSIAAALLRAGQTPERDVTLAGQSCEFLVRRPEGDIALMLDAPGVADGHGLRRRLRRVDAAQRTGTRVLRVPVWRAQADPADVARDLLGKQPGPIDGSTIHHGLDCDDRGSGVRLRRTRGQPGRIAPELRKESIHGNLRG